MAAQRNSNRGDEVYGESATALPESSSVAPTTITSRTVDGTVEVTVSTTLKVNLGNYESKDIFGSAKGRFAEDTSPESAGEFLLDFIYGAVNDELAVAKELAPNSSAVHKIVTT